MGRNQKRLGLVDVDEGEDVCEDVCEDVDEDEDEDEDVDVDVDVDESMRERGLVPSLLHQYYTITAPLLHHYCTTTTPLLQYTYHHIYAYTHNISKLYF